MTLIAETLIAALLVIGGVFGLIGSFGLLKLRTPMQRLHSPTKATTVGVGAALIASSVFLYLMTGVVSLAEILITVFLFLTAPVSALYLGKAHLHAGIDRDKLPKTTTLWAGDAKDDPSQM